MADSDEFRDPYVDPGTGLLLNLIGASTKAELENAEADLSFSRLIQLMDRPPNATGDLGELCAIHRHLFQDIYEWAGEIRTVDVRKNVPGAEFFLPVAMITRASAFAANGLRSDGMLHGLKRGQFIDRLSHHYEQFNYIHPFREGNGRAQRVFWNRIARDAGWQLDWRTVRGSVNDDASRVAAEQRDFGPLHEMFDQIVSKAAPGSARNEEWHAAERARMSFERGPSGH
jgi:cell filamentation protein